MSKKGKKRKLASGDIAVNRAALRRYHFEEKVECGIELLGSEVKSLRDGKAQLTDSYATIDDGEVWLHGFHIPPYPPAAGQNHEPDRRRRLLLHRQEIDRLAGRAQRKGQTLVPTRVYFSGPRAKVELALARGKEQRDRRREIRDRDVRREVEREYKQKVR